MNWVKSRFDCFIDNIWTALRGQMEQDIAQWRELFEAVSTDVNLTETDQGLTVSRRTGPETSIRSMLKKAGSRIEVWRYDSLAEQRKLFQFVPFVNRKGQCCLMLQRAQEQAFEQEELELWQASRHVLDRILFPGF